MARDPVCGMDVDPGEARWTSTHDGATYYFCSKGCKEAFDADPATYLGSVGGHMEHRGS